MGTNVLFEIKFNQQEPTITET